MKVIDSTAAFTGRTSVVALGMFDGVHIGHQALIRAAVALADQLCAQSVVCTFDRHPLSVLCPERAPEPILTLEENLRKFERLGAQWALVERFTPAFASILPEDYLEMLVDQMRVKAIVIGENHTFGRDGRGNARMVRQLATKYGYQAKVVPSVTDADGLVSSTRIREMLRRGDRVRAEALLAIAPETSR